MDFEASTSSSPSATNPSTIGDHNKRGGRNSRRREPGKRSRIWLGTFPNPEMAAAKLNFPESGDRLPPAHADIQRAAGEFVIPLSESNPCSTSSLMSENASESSMRVDVLEEEEEEEGEKEVEFVDEEAMFNMPLLVDCMAEGMLLTPPAIKKGFNWTQHEHHNFDFTLWDY